VRTSKYSENPKQKRGSKFQNWSPILFVAYIHVNITVAQNFNDKGDFLDTFFFHFNPKGKGVDSLNQELLKTDFFYLFLLSDQKDNSSPLI